MTMFLSTTVDSIDSMIPRKPLVAESPQVSSWEETASAKKE